MTSTIGIIAGGILFLLLVLFARRSGETARRGKSTVLQTAPKNDTVKFIPASQASRILNFEARLRNTAMAEESIAEVVHPGNKERLIARNAQKDKYVYRGIISGRTCKGFLSLSRSSRTGFRLQSSSPFLE